MEELFKKFEFYESTNYVIKEINGTHGLEDSYCEAPSLYEFIIIWDFTNFSKRLNVIKKHDTIQMFARYN